jgi:DNA-binding transcriptional regulator YiaG
MAPDQFKEIVRKRFRATTLANDTGQANLARITGYSREHVSRWANGRKRIPNAMVMILMLMEKMDLNHEHVKDVITKKGEDRDD